MAIVIAGWANGLGLAMAVALLLLLVVFAGFGRQVAAMTLGMPAATAIGDAATVDEPQAPLAHPVTAGAGTDGRHRCWWP